MSKRSIEPIYVARGNGWYVTFDRTDRDYAAFADNGLLVLIGFFKSQDAAVSACDAYVRDTLVRS